MRYLVPLILAIVPFFSHAQKVRMSAGGGYTYGRSQAFDYPVDLYNFSHPSLSLSYLRQGFYLTADASYGFSQRLFFTPTFSYRYMENGISPNIYAFKTQVHFYEAFLAVELYFPPGGKKNSTAFSRGFHVAPLAGLGYASPRITQNGKLFALNGKDYKPRAPFSLVGGILSYDAFLTEQLSLTPRVEAIYYFSLHVPDLSSAYANSALLAFEETRHGMFNLKVGAVFRWHNKKSLFR